MANGKGECVCSVLAKTITTKGGLAASKSDCGKQVQQRVRLTVPAPSEGVAATAGKQPINTHIQPINTSERPITHLYTPLTPLNNLLP